MSSAMALRSMLACTVLACTVAFTPSVPMGMQAARSVSSIRSGHLSRAPGVRMSYLNHPKVGKDITEVIGRTPMVRLNKVIGDCPAEIIVKLESMEPCSSVKDRIGLALIEEGEKRGELVPGVSILVEPTSGNTGIALAMVAAAKGYELILVMPESMSNERRILLKAFGAKVILTPGYLGMQGAISKSEEVADAVGENAFILGQFENPDNIKCHFDRTGPEIWEQMEGRVDAFVAGVGTGGTITGVGRFLKSKNKNLKVYAVEPKESPVLSGGDAGQHKIQGIGAGFIPDNCDVSVIDEILLVSSEEAMAMSRRMACEEGILCGISSGAAVNAAIQAGYMPEMKGKRIVTILPSFGERYLSTQLFSDLMESSLNQEVEAVRNLGG